MVFHKVCGLLLISPCWQLSSKEYLQQKLPPKFHAPPSQKWIGIHLGRWISKWDLSILYTIKAHCVELFLKLPLPYGWLSGSGRVRRASGFPTERSRRFRCSLSVDVIAAFSQWGSRKRENKSSTTYVLHIMKKNRDFFEMLHGKKPHHHHRCKTDLENVCSSSPLPFHLSFSPPSSPISRPNCMTHMFALECYKQVISKQWNLSIVLNARVMDALRLRKCS